MGWTEFSRSEQGAAGAWSLFVFMVCAVVAGVSIDGTNGIRAKEHLRSTADMAAHAGVIELALGGDDASIREAVAASVAANMPLDDFGNVLGDASKYIEIGYFADGTFSTGSIEDDNAVAVELNMSKAFGNPVRTFLLGFIGWGEMEVAAASVSVMDQSANCKGNDGIYAHGEIKMTSTSEIGPGFCIFSKDVVSLSNHNTFHPGAHVGMPDLAQCSHCFDEYNPGVEKAKFESNMQLVDVGEHVTNVINSLLGLGTDPEPMTEFMNDVTYSGSLTPLEDLGYNANKINKGSIIEISAAEFETLDPVPTGLIYAVYCGSPLTAKNPVTKSPSSTKGGAGLTGANLKTLSMETPTGSTITDVAVVTNCKLNFGNTAHIVNSVVATQSTSVQSISASSYARIGNGSLVCPDDEKVVIMSMGDMSIPAGMETNNVDFYIAGNASIASGTSGQMEKLGTSFYIGGLMQISAQGNWTACGDDPDSFTPSIESIRHVIAAYE